ncbi:hypothetical protein B0H17DRAFT_1333989 [Mycena rosella]|uniref:Uncharacterized protein n=1 Tax=Mycena rosella TaxID=1033263 RepID=A0AAD7D598_MYCRO|nr:hypothetical protein B0H17DRAFT_1333989 [Mycena rosella]
MHLDLPPSSTRTRTRFIPPVCAFRPPVSSSSPHSALRYSVSGSRVTYSLSHMGHIPPSLACCGGISCLTFFLFSKRHKPPTYAMPNSAARSFTPALNRFHPFAYLQIRRPHTHLPFIQPVLVKCKQLAPNSVSV